jgi:hypothetical protein
MTNERTNKNIDMKFSFHAKRKKEKEIIAHKINDDRILMRFVLVLL